MLDEGGGISMPRHPRPYVYDDLFNNSVSSCYKRPNNKKPTIVGKAISIIILLDKLWDEIRRWRLKRK